MLRYIEDKVRAKVRAVDRIHVKRAQTRARTDTHTHTHVNFSRSLIQHVSHLKGHTRGQITAKEFHIESYEEKVGNAN